MKNKVTLMLPAAAEDLRPMATATVAEVWGHSYSRRSYL